MRETTDATAVTPLTERPGFLLSQLGFHAAARFTQRLAPLGLHPRRFGLLSHLADRDGQTQQRLADALGVHRNVMVGMIDDLEARTLVQRRRHPDDRRAYAIYLTDTARQLLPEARRAADDHDNEVLAGLNNDERRHLIALLQRLAEHTDLPGGVHPELRATEPTRPAPNATFG